ncbi:carbon storage regulator [Bythopirellula polymerisocia]|uniref:Translational regulator CsrA n=1 Tax=Bythopirellula polymerisocia TaxID=2528003 RepID=A0A5C6CH68_9BACT|nr:carbon storage regulator [Bythopirellula polymerisocia]TWU23698.1 Carbon storage regulator [Bythopirellula polymerisocia]
MLVLTRKQNEKIKIGENITITVLRMKGKGVRLGIQAPEDMNVLRGELVFDIENEEGAQGSDQEATRTRKLSQEMRNAGRWSNDSRPDSKMSSLENSAAGCQVGWCI